MFDLGRGIVTTAHTRNTSSRWRHAPVVVCPSDVGQSMSDVKARCTRPARTYPHTIVRNGVCLDQRPIMYKRIDPLISASRGTLAGDLLWLAAIGFIVAIVTGLIG